MFAWAPPCLARARSGRKVGPRGSPRMFDPRLLWMRLKEQAMDLAGIINLLFTVVYFLVLARILMSWLPMMGIRIDPYHPVIQFLYSTTDVFLEPFRRLIPPIANMDLSPMIALLVLDLVRQLVVSLLGG